MQATPTTPCQDGAVAAYEDFAPFYDTFTADYAYDSWMSDLEGLALGAGLSGRRLLDAACGTGKSFVPMLERGYEVTACDISPAMVARARRRAAGRADVLVADMRALPWQGRFDLITCVDDSMNYLLSTADLVAALRSMGEALSPGGLALFDTNSLAAYRSTFASEFSLESQGSHFRWRGEGSEFMPPGETAAVTIELLRPGADPVPIGRHVQRHHPIEAVELACAEAGLDLLEVRGESPDDGFVPDPDEEVHQRIVFVAARPPASERG